jgi:hypothetical protein
MMSEHICDVCGQPATIHETALIDGVATSRHVCHSHGETMLLKPTFDLEHDDFQQPVEQYRSLSPTERDQIALYYRLSRRHAI